MKRQAAAIGNAECRKGLGRVTGIAAALMLGACAQIGDMGGLMSANSEPPPGAPSAVAAVPGTDLEKATDYWGKEFSKNPRDAKSSLAYARNLRALGRKQEALGVLQAGYMHNSENREMLSEYGRLALEFEQVSTAAPLLERADDPARPDWRVISARGTVMAKQGRYKEAIEFFERAKTLAPTQASVLSNLALAYTLDGQAARAEGLLRTAAAQPDADPKVRQNLAMVMGLQGRSPEAVPVPGAATAVARAGEPAARSASDVAHDRPILDGWTAKVVSAGSAGGARADATSPRSFSTTVTGSTKSPRASSKPRDDMPALRRTQP